MKLNWGKIVLGSIGLLFTLYAGMLIMLMLIGKPTTAIITSYRQEYGERNEAIPNQYTYLFGYEFEVDGRVYSGNGQVVKNPVHLKDSGKMLIKIRYAPFFPFINSPIEAKLPTVAIGIYLLIGLGLGALAFQKPNVE